MARRPLSFEIDDLSFRAEDFEFVTFLTTSYSYQFLSSLEETLNIHLTNNGIIQLTNKKITESHVIYTYYDENRKLLYILIDMAGNKLHKLLQYSDKLLMVSGTFNRMEPVRLLESANMPDVMECKHLNFSELETVGDKPNKYQQAMISLFKYLSAEDTGFVFQIFQYFQYIDLENKLKKDEEKKDFYF